MGISRVVKSLDLGLSTSIKWWQNLLSRFFCGIKMKASGTVLGSVNFSWMQCLLWSFWLIFLQRVLEGGAQSILIKIMSFTDDVSCPGFKSRLWCLDEVITRSVLAPFEDFFWGGRGALFPSAWTSLPSTGENQPETEGNTKNSRKERRGRHRRRVRGKEREYHFAWALGSEFA